MFKEVMEHNTVIDLPILALILFLTVFLAVSIYVWRSGRDNPQHEYLASLPLEDDETSIRAARAEASETPDPNAKPRGGDHG